VPGELSGEHCQVSWIGQVAKVTLPAEVDVAIAADVRDELLDAIGQGAAVVIADMTATVFCDSAGVTALAVAHKDAVTRGGQVRVVTSAPQVLRVLELTGLDLLIGVYPSEAQALADEPGPDDDQALAGEGQASG
jgi:anti-sigma B factor antagonist